MATSHRTEKTQKNFVNEVASDQGTFNVVDEIWFEVSDTLMPYDKFYNISIFDVSPNKTSLYRALAVPDDFYTPKNILGMITDVNDIRSTHDIKIAMKPKRDYSTSHSKYYAKLFNNLQITKLITLINPQVLAKSLIKHFKIIICAPFTSPGIIAKILVNYIVHYDSNKIVMAIDEATDGIEILQSKEALAEFLDTHINNLSCFEGVQNDP